jgi:hypothetical protein
MQTRGLLPLRNDHPIAGRSTRSIVAGAAALGAGAFLAGGWVAAFSVLLAVRVAQSVFRRRANRGGGGNGPGSSGGNTLGMA